MWHQPCQRCKYTTSRYKKLLSRVESHASAVSLLESGEQRYIKAIIKLLMGVSRFGLAVRR